MNEPLPIDQLAIQEHFRDQAFLEFASDVKDESREEGAKLI